ncbi:MAG: Asp23/Gls24 family envelope stress response protein, partial [Bacteroidetes bacterium]
EQQQQHLYEATTAVPIRLRLSARLGADLHALADAVRDAVQQAVAEHTGLHAARIDVEFTDVVPVRSSPSPSAA